MDSELLSNTTRNLTMALGDGVCIAFLMAMALTLFGGTKRLKDEWYLPVGAALVQICINWLVIELFLTTNWLGFLFIFASLGFMLFLAIWWGKEGSTIKEMIPFLVMGGMFYLSAENSMSQIVYLMPELAEKSIVAIPTLSFIALVGFIVSNYFFFHSKISASGKKVGMALMGLAAVGLTVFAITVSIEGNVRLSKKLPDITQALVLNQKPD